MSNEKRSAGALRGALLLSLTALIWGCAFVAQSVAMDAVGPFTFVAVRFFLSGAILLPVICLRKRGEAAAVLDPEAPGGKRKSIIIPGMLCGIFLFLGATLQQIGIQYTEAGTAGFLTALYIVLVPVYSIFLGRMPGKKIFAAVPLTIIGMYLLCINGAFRVGRGDLFCILCAFAFPVQILLVDHFVQSFDAVALSSAEFFTVSLIALGPALLLEHPQPGTILSAAVPILYAGILSGGVAYTLQAVGQKELRNPSAASLIMSLESVFAAIAGWLLLGEIMTPRKLAGCVIMFAGIIAAQL